LPARSKARLASTIDTPRGRWGLAFSADGRWLVTTGGGKAFIYDAGTGKRLLEVSGHTLNPRKGKNGAIYAVALSPDSKMLATAGADAIRLWDAKTGKPLGVLGEKDPQPGISHLAFSPDGKTLASGGVEVRTWDLAKLQQKTRFRAAQSNKCPVAFTKDGKLFALAREGLDSSTVHILDGVTGKKIHALEGRAKYARAVAFSQDTRRAVTASGDYVTGQHALRVWDTATGKEVGQLARPKSLPGGVALSPDNSTLAVSWVKLDAKGSTASPMSSVLVMYDVASGKEREALPVDAKAINRLAFGPGGDKLAVSITYKPVVQLWELPAKPRP
jgi:WD40 repeat protein